MRDLHVGVTRNGDRRNSRERGHRFAESCRALAGTDWAGLLNSIFHHRRGGRCGSHAQIDPRRDAIDIVRSVPILIPRACRAHVTIAVAADARSGRRALGNGVPCRARLCGSLRSAHPPDQRRFNVDLCLSNITVRVASPPPSRVPRLNVGTIIVARHASGQPESHRSRLVPRTGADSAKRHSPAMFMTIEQRRRVLRASRTAEYQASSPLTWLDSVARSCYVGRLNDCAVGLQLRFG